MIVCLVIDETELELAHIHSNDCCSLDQFDNPTVIGVSFEKNLTTVSDLFKIPQNLDQNCNPKGPDIKISLSNINSEILYNILKI